MTTNVKPDDEPFGPFTVAEVENCFKAFDLDDNGFVGAGELRKLSAVKLEFHHKETPYKLSRTLEYGIDSMNRIYQYLGENATDEDIDEMIRMCDQDGDGQITFDEFARMIFRHSGPPKIVRRPIPKLLSPREQQKILTAEPIKKKLAPISSTIGGSPSFKMMTVNERADRAFVLKNMISQIHFQSKNMDEIHSNFLKECDNQQTGMCQYEAFCKSISEKSKNPICESLFKLFQPNSNKQIDFRDFLISVVHLVTENKALKVRFAFNVFDTDGNGYIDENELLQILKSTHMATSEEQVQSKVKAIMRQIDVNNDGQLSLDEFHDVTQKFPNLIFPALNKT